MILLVPVTGNQPPLTTTVILVKITITSPTAMTSQLAFQLLSLLTPTLHLVFSHNQVTQLNKLNLITSCSTFCSGSCFTRRKATIFIMVCNTIFHPVMSPLTSSLSTALLATLSPCLTSGTFLPWCLCTGCFICQENSCPASWLILSSFQSWFKYHLFSENYPSHSFLEVETPPPSTPYLYSQVLLSCSDFVHSAHHLLTSSLLTFYDYCLFFFRI